MNKRDMDHAANLTISPKTAQNKHLKKPRNIIRKLPINKNMKTLLAFFGLLLVFSVAAPSTAYAHLTVSYRSSAVFVGFRLGRGYYVRPVRRIGFFGVRQPHTHRMPRPGTYAQWKKNNLAGSKWALEKMARYNASTKMIAVPQKQKEDPQLKNYQKLYSPEQPETAPEIKGPENFETDFEKKKKKKKDDKKIKATEIQLAQK